jgi:phosphate transport system protein
MFRRKIQLIAGTTYSVSLPKEWVKKNNLKEKDEVLMLEKGDRKLILTTGTVSDNPLKEYSLNIDDYVDNIEQVLFSLYYIGIESINLFSKNEIAKDIRARVIDTTRHMSGTEIGFEDSKRITVKVLLDRAKIDVAQVLYRISLIIDLSASSIVEELNIEEIRTNDNEIDRLYHLIAKMISLSLLDSNVLSSSKIRNASLIPSYFLIAKKLENIADDISRIAEYIFIKLITFSCSRFFLFMKIYSAILLISFNCKDDFFEFA